MKTWALIVAGLIAAVGASGCLGERSDDSPPEPTTSPTHDELWRQALAGSDDPLDRFELAILELLDRENAEG